MQINCVIVGAQKAGTTSLHNYLCEHPEVNGQFVTEFSAFIDDKEFDQGIEKAVAKYFDDTLENHKILLAKGALISNYEKALKRIKNYNPKTKIIFLIREPVSRAYSSYTFEKMHGAFENKKFDEVVNVLERDEKQDGMYRLFIKLGLYYEHLVRIFEYFSNEQVLIINFEEIKDSPLETCQKVFNFLNIDRTFIPNLNKVHNQTKQIRSQLYAKFLVFLMTKTSPLKRLVKKLIPYKRFNNIRNILLDLNKKDGKYEPMTLETKSYLKEYFRPYNRKLENLLDIDLSNWDDLKNS